VASIAAIVAHRPQLTAGASMVNPDADLTPASADRDDPSRPADALRQQTLSPARDEIFRK
jgi:hypothetical protein